MTFANRSWYLGWLNLSTRIRNSIKKRRGKKLMVDDYSSLVQIKQKGQKRKKKGRSETIHTLLQSRPRKSRLLVRNASQQQQPQPIGLNFLDGGFLFFFHQRELLADDTRALLPFLFFDSLHHDAKKSLRLLLFFLGLLFFYASHTISISHLLHIFFFSCRRSGDGLDWDGGWAYGVEGCSGIRCIRRERFFFWEFSCTHMKHTRPRIRWQRCKLIISIIHVYDLIKIKDARLLLCAGDVCKTIKVKC